MSSALRHLRPPTVIQFRELYELSTEVGKHQGATQKKLMGTMLENTLSEISTRLVKVASFAERVLPQNQHTTPAIARINTFCIDAATDLEKSKSAITADIDMGPVIANLKALDKDLQRNVDACIVQYSLEKLDTNSSLAFCVNKYLSQTVLSVIGIRTLAQNMNSIYKALLPCQAEFRRTPSIFQANCSLDSLVDHVIENVSALCLEKHGVFPKITFKSKDRIYLLCVPGHLVFLLTEILKNSTSALIRKHGIDADRAEPIEIRAGGDGDELAIRIADKGAGMSFAQTQHAFRWFFTTAPKANESYTFSGDFGGQLEGKGVGLPLARSYAKFMGGDVHLQSLPTLGTDAYIYLNKNPRF